MATPTHCTIYSVDGRLRPLERDARRRSTRPRSSASTRARTAAPARARCGRSSRASSPGPSNPIAGAFSDFHLKLDRDDGDQFLGDLNFRMPPGFTGDLRGISYCPEAAIAAAAQNSGRAEQASPSCPASSQIGTTNVAAGPGGHPFHAVGKMYLAGPVQGRAAVSLVAITPALAGPYDYGVVVVRVALHVDPLTAQVSAVSDTVPSIIGGVPIRMRSIQVNIDKPNFTINPTNCSPFSVDSQGIGDQGTVDRLLLLLPRRQLRDAALQAEDDGPPARRPARTPRGASNPALQFDLRTRPGDANIKSLSVTLPKAFAIDQRHLGNICSEKRSWRPNQCAGRQPIGDGDDDDAAARPAAHGPGLRGLGLRQTAARSPSSSTARST